MWDEGNGGFGDHQWTNWVGNQTCNPTKVVEASTEEAVSEAVVEARQKGLRIRTPGAGHSFTPSALTDGIMLNTRGLQGIRGIDAERQHVSALAHTTIKTFGDPLWEAGLALKNQGDIDSQAIAGAIATSTHGSGPAFQSFSGALSACRLVDGTGTVRTLSRDDDPDFFGAVQTSIGMLGIMTEVTIDVMPAYHLHEQIVFMHADEVMERWDDLLSTYRHFSFFWMPTDGSSVLYGFPEAKADMCMVKLYRETEEQPGDRDLPEGERIDRSYRIYPHVFEPNFHELEYFLPAENAKQVFRNHRDLMLKSLPDSIYPMEVRFVAQDDAWLSPNYKRPSVVISVSGKPGTDYWPYLRLCDEHLYGGGGRPHWGKLHFMTAARLAERFPRYEDFRKIRRQFDPDGLFLNDHLRPLFE